MLLFGFVKEEKQNTTQPFPLCPELGPAILMLTMRAVNRKMLKTSQLRGPKPEGLQSHPLSLSVFVFLFLPFLFPFPAGSPVTQADFKLLTQPHPVYDSARGSKPGPPACWASTLPTKLHSQPSVPTPEFRDRSHVTLDNPASSHH